MSNFPATLFARRFYAVIGLGRAGLAAMRALSAMGARVTGWDDALLAREKAVAEGFVIADPTDDIGDITALILSPGIPHKLPSPHRLALAAQAAGRPILTDAEILYEAVRAAGSNARFAGITGTNGKSTTTALLAHILTLGGIPNVAGANLGTAALALPLLQDRGVYVLEMSSYMLERLASLRFDVAAMLNLSPDHIDRHGDMAGYAAAKRQIFARQRFDDTAVIGIDDAYSVAMAAGIPNVIRISAKDKADIWCDADFCLRDAAGVIADLRNARALPGRHNAQNAAAVFALARKLGLDDTTIRAGIGNFPGLPHRQELIGEIDGVRYINDSKATNADAASRALSCYDKIIWIAGGIAKEGGIESLKPFFPRIAHSLLIGRDAKNFAAILRQEQVAFTEVETLENAVASSHDLAAQLGATAVLLSPAAASFDQFSGFEQRGDYFRALVKELAARKEFC
jgi:UDP-N-acetylmuramoylalanine--D-glutamate ligase